MDDVTDTVFRRVVSDCAAPDMNMTEFVNVDGLCSPGREKLMPRLKNSCDVIPVIAQIWGKRPENFEQIACEIASGTIPGYAGVDLNFGCPDKAVLKNECCSALQQPDLRHKAVEIIEATQRGIETARGSASSKEIFPLSIKTRLGFDQVDYSWHELLLGFKPSMLSVHVRTTRQMSKVTADWAAIEPIVELRDKISPNTKIVLNGDIMHRDQGLELARKHGVDGIMIGRGVFRNPYCFADDAEAVWATKGAEDRIVLFKKHIELFQGAYEEDERKYAPLKKFAKIYVSDFPSASDYREKIMNSNSVNEALNVIESFKV